MDLGLPSPEIYFLLFLEESGRLSEKTLRSTLEDSPPIYSSRSFGENGDIPYANLFNFSGKPIDKRLEGILSYQEALGSGGKLRNYLAPALGLRHTERFYSITLITFHTFIWQCWDIILQQKYVLTPDFALKLLIIHERLNAGQAVILSGDTVWHSPTINL